MMTEACGATNSTMMEVGGAKSVRQFNYVCGNRCETVYFMMRRKLLYRMKEVCGATSCMMDELIVENIKWMEPSF